jgi:hypothetical protein
MLIGGTVFVAAEGTAPSPGAEPPSPGAEPKAPPKAADPKAKNGGPEKGTPKQEKAVPAQEKAAPPQDKAAPPKDKAPSPKEKAVEPKDKATTDKPKDAAPKSDKTDPKASKTGEKPAASDKGTAKISVEQRTEIRQTIIKQGNAPRVTNVNFNISVGTAVPRTVQVAVLPPRVVEIYPAWRGYRYFIVGERIIIIDDGWQIVFIIET